MRSQDIVNTLVTLKQKSLSVNSRAQVITMSNGGELATGGGPYPVRALYNMRSDEQTWGTLRARVKDGDLRAKERIYGKREYAIIDVLSWSIRRQIASHCRSTRNHVHDHESYGRYPGWRGAYWKRCRCDCGFIPRCQYCRLVLWGNSPIQEGTYVGWHEWHSSFARIKSFSISSLEKEPSSKQHPS